MKNFIGIILLSLLSGNLLAANNAFRKVSELFSTQDAFIANELSKQTIRLYIKDKKLTDEDKDLLKNIDRLCFLTFDKNYLDTNPNILFEEVEKSYDFEYYTLFKFEKNKIGSKKIYIKESGEHISHLVLIQSANKKSTLIELKGKLHLQKMAHLGDLMNIDGLNILESSNKESSTQQLLSHQNRKSLNKRLNLTESNKTVPELKRFDFKNAPRNHFHPWYIQMSSNNDNSASSTYLMVPEKNDIKTYNRYGQLTYKITKGNEPDVKINGCDINKPMRDAMALVSSDCIKTISVNKNTNENDAEHPNGLIEVKLKGKDNQAFVVCEGKLFFNQDSIMECIDINDPFAPLLVFDCEKFKLREIQNIEPEVIESIQFSSNAENCENIESGDYIVLKSK